MPSRNYVYRETVPPILWAWRLALFEDKTFTFVCRLYAGDDGFDQSAAGSWREHGTLVHLTATSSDTSVIPVATEVTLQRGSGETLRLGTRDLQPDDD